MLGGMFETWSKYHLLLYLWTYYGRLISTTHVNVQRQRKQADLGKNEKFKLAFSKKIIDAKIRNQVVILRRYARSSHADVGRAVDEMQYMCKKVQNAGSIEQLMGYEGTAARKYFQVLGQLIEPELHLKEGPDVRRWIRSTL